jgi:hypothetical protein
MATVKKANDKYRSTLRSTWIYDPADATLSVTSVPDNVPTYVVVGWETDYETLFSVEGSAGDNSSNYTLTGVTWVKGYEGNLPSGTAVNCLNNEEFFNQYETRMNEFEDTMDDLSDEVDATVANVEAIADTLVSNKNSIYDNVIINGNFDIWQRGTSFTAASEYTADRWYWNHYGKGGDDSTIARGEHSVGDINGARYFLKVTHNDTASAHHWLYYVLETQDTLKLAGQEVTLSFYYKNPANATNTWEVVAASSTSADTKSVANEAAITGTTTTLTNSATWVKKTVTFTVPSTCKTLTLRWYSLNNEVADEVFNLSQVKLELGDTATTYQPRSYAEELALCQRYCKVITTEVAYQNIITGHINATSTGILPMYFDIPFRSATPELTATATDWQLGYAASGADLTNLTLNKAGSKTIELQATVSGTPLTVGESCYLRADATTGRKLILSAEL